MWDSFTSFIDLLRAAEDCPQQPLVGGCKRCWLRRDRIIRALFARPRPVRYRETCLCFTNAASVPGKSAFRKRQRLRLNSPTRSLLVEGRKDWRPNDHAKAEMITTTPAFREAIKCRRCLVPEDA